LVVSACSRLLTEVNFDISVQCTQQTALRIIIGQSLFKIEWR